MEIYNKVLTYIQKHNLINNNDKIICAVSGGADSVCMLEILVELKKIFSLELYVAHLNHQLRGNEANRDEKFVEELAFKHNLPFYSKKVDVNALSKQLKVSCEEAGRIARYSFFDELKKQLKANKIATAHNRNDNVETVLMRLFRGTDLKGLCGIPVSNNKCVIRPILCLQRCEIEEYLKQKDVEHITDSTNSEDIYLRNKIRNNIIPLVEKELNPNFSSVFSANIDLLSEANNFIEKNVETIYQRLLIKGDCFLSFSTASLLNEDAYIVKRIIKKAIYELDSRNISNELCNLIYSSLSYDSSVNIGTDLFFYVKYQKAYFVKKRHFDEFSYKITSSGIYKICELGMTLEVVENIGCVNFNSKNTIYLDADKVSCDFTIRHRNPGDKLFLAKCGNKKIKDIFIDAKIPVFLRDNYPVLEYNGQVIWLCGIRDDINFRAKSGNKYIKLTIHKEKNNE